MTDFYTRKDINKETIEFTITIPKEEFQKEYTVLLKKQLQETDIKGFRKGKVPTDFVEPQVGNTLKIQAFEKLVPMLLTTILQKENIEPIAPPEYKNLPDFKEGSEMVFTVNITVMPEYKLGNLKNIKIEKEEIKVGDSEVDEALENLRKNQETKSKEINEEWAIEIIKLLKLEKEIKNLKDLKEHIKNAMLKQKEHMVMHKVQDEALEKAIETSKIVIPEPAIKYEAEERERAFVTDMQQKNVNMNEFLKANNLTLEKMRELWLKDAKQALETDILLRTYVLERNIKVTDEDLKKKIEEIKLNAPEGTDKSIFDNEQWQEYIRRVEEKEKAFQSFIKEVLGE